MFIKVHNIDESEMYINTDLIECIDQDKEDKLTRLYVCGDAESYYKCQETPEELMKIIGYFKVANDKWKLSENGDPTLDTPVAFFSTKDK